MIRPKYYEWEKEMGREIEALETLAFLLAAKEPISFALSHLRTCTRSEMTYVKFGGLKLGLKSVPECLYQSFKF